MFLLATTTGGAAPDTYAAFLAVTGALAKLVVLSMCLERALAFVFEHEWFTRLTKKNDDSGKSRMPGLKGVLALGLAATICVRYQFDIIMVLFAEPRPTLLGMIMTALVASGGSAGAISLFQGFLNISKESRDAVITARKVEAEKAVSLANAKKDRIEAEAGAAVARANAEKAELELAEAIAKKKKLAAEPKTRRSR